MKNSAEKQFSLWERQGLMLLQKQGFRELRGGNSMAEEEQVPPHLKRQKPSPGAEAQESVALGRRATI
jgi:hypothetical protein